MGEGTDGATGGSGSGDCWLDAGVAVVGAGSSEDAEGPGGSAGLESDVGLFAEGTEGIEIATGAANSIDGVLVAIVFTRSLVLLLDFRLFFGGSAVSNCAA